jgi:hypothetical protein
MVIIWGSGMYGKVDEVPGVCHVATRFGHLYYVPLIPLGSFAVISQDGDNIQGASLPLSFKSILTAWLRAALILAGAVLVIVGITTAAADSLLAGGLTIALGVAAWAIFYFTYRWSFFRQAGYERAVQIGQRLGLNPEGMVMLEVAYGRLTAEQALDELERRQAAAPKPQSFQFE